MRPLGRRGNYTLLMAFAVVVVVGIAALVVDAGRARLAGTEAQEIADAAAEAAVMALKRFGTEAAAEDAALAVVGSNRVSGIEPTLLEFEIGGWDNADQVWSSDGRNAARVSVGREGSDALLLPVARLFGWEFADVRRTSIAATVNLQVVLVVDITGSWDKDNFYHARAAALTFLDLLHNAHGDEDIVAMSVFFQRFGWELTPFTSVAASAGDETLVRDQWETLNVGSYAGEYQAAWETNTSKHVACKVYGTTNNGGSPWSGWCSSGRSCWQASLRDNFTTPADGCHPTMPRYYSDEGGTDYTTGMEMARKMFRERPDPFAYRAMIVLTDGQPYGYTTSTRRTSAGYAEARFREYQYPGSHSASAIETDTVSLARSMYTEDDVHTWFISFVEYDSFMEDASQGDGYFRLAPTAEELEGIFENIARSMPISVVR